MELKELQHIINTHLSENSLAEAKYYDDIFEDSVIVDHPNNKQSSSIIITKSMGCWHLEFERVKGKGVSIEMKIETTSNHEDIDEILNFVNAHTMHGTVEPVTEQSTH